MRFVVDVMLGRLARWLRILGYDTLYSNTYRDEELAKIADLEERCLLTRDRELLSRYMIGRAYLVDSDYVFDQLRELVSEFHLEIGGTLLTRCVSCNNEIREVSRNDVHGLVPDFVFRTARCFYRCDSCNKVYWPGTHVTRILEKIDHELG
jgi:uncharacterized protein with PIN domain